jgi:hypothetical protein
LRDLAPHLLLWPSVLAVCCLVWPLHAAEPTKPAMTVILESGEILAGQAIGLDVWIENPTDAKATDVRLRYAGPPFLKIGTWEAANKTGMPESPKKCLTDPTWAAKQGPEPAAAVEQDGAIFLDSIQPRSALNLPPRLCLLATSTVEERDWVLGFAVTYTLADAQKPTSGVLLAEKKLSVGLFGTESVGGVSLRLAAYLIPGLLFMMILRLGGYASLTKLEAPEVATLSVLVSVVLFLLVDRNVPFQGISSAVSATAFLTLCLAAIVISGILVLIRCGIEWCQANKRRALVIETGDDRFNALRKALRGAGGDLRPVTIITRDQTKYVGSLVAPTSSGGIVLFGWFGLRPPAGNDPLRNELQQLIDSGQVESALQRAHDANINPQMQDFVRRLSNNGTLENTTDEMRRFAARDILDRSRDAVPDLQNTGPLVVGTP